MIFEYQKAYHILHNPEHEHQSLYSSISLEINQLEKHCTVLYSTVNSSILLSGFTLKPKMSINCDLNIG